MLLSHLNYPEKLHSATVLTLLSLSFSPLFIFWICLQHF